MSILDQFTRLSLPDCSFANQTIVITGANTGLGLEAARHFVRLGASKVILGCRNAASGAAAMVDISSSTGRDDICEVWELDMADFTSIHRFVQRASALERLDAVVANAGVAKVRHSMTTAGIETTIAVNVVGTFLLAIGSLPLLRKSTAQTGIPGHLVIVSSGVHKWAKFNERHEPAIFEALAKDDKRNKADRYNVSKLLQVLVVRSLAQLLPPGPSGDVPVIINAVDPGLCKTGLAREVRRLQKVIFNLVNTAIGRTAEEGSKTLVYAASAPRETHGQYLACNKVATPSDFVVSKDGIKTQGRVWDELVALLETLQPGIKAMLTA